MKISEIKKLPTVIGNNHESLFKHYHTLEKVREMLERGDSNETIIEIINELVD